MIVFYLSFILLFCWTQSLNESCFKDICFTVGKTNVNYTSAIEECKKLNQTLAFISDKSAQLFIQNLINSTNHTFYIGLKYIPKERFIWESNSYIVPDLNWSSNIYEPLSELCVFLSNDTMNAGECNFTRYFICSNTSDANSEIVNPEGSCAKGFFKYLNKCYKMNLNCNDESKKWNEAHSICKSFDNTSNLIVVNSMIEQEFLTALMTKSPQAVWSDLRHSSVNNNVFPIWIDENSKMPVYRINFKKNEPNNIHNERCLMVYHRLSNVGQFNDENCSRYLNFICQGPLIMQNSSDNKYSSQNPLFYQGKCKSKYFEFNETCYKVEKTLASYETANKTCNGKLLFVYGFIDTAFIRSLMALEGVSNVWINVNSSNSISGVKSLQKEIKAMKNEAINSSSCYYIEHSRKGLIQATSCSEKHSYICYEFLDGHENEIDDLICPLNWIRVGKKCFSMKNHVIEFDEGANLCKIYNSRIAKLTNMKEAQAIKNVFTGDFWIDLNGKSYQINERIDHTKLDYCLFRHTTNIYQKIKANPSQYCFFQRSSKIEWDFIKCDETKSLICEQPARKDDCPSNLNLNIDGDCYGKIDINKTWADAEKYCKNIGGNNSHLASFHSYEQESTLLSKLNNTSRLWIGLQIYDYTKRWIDQSTVNYENPSYFSPSYSEGMSCYSTFKVKDKNKIWWYKENCGTHLPFLCKLSKNNVVNYTFDESIIKPDFYCPQGFTKHGLGCFKLYDEPLTWVNADRKCQSLVKNQPKVARLARFDTLQEYESVLSSFRAFNGSIIWIGLYKHLELKQYLWLDENRFQILKTVFNDSKTGENSVAMELATNPFRNGRWIMLAGIKHFPFLCRIDPHEYFNNETDNPNAFPYTNISNSKCHAPFVEYDENCYYYNAKPLVFDEADKNCKSVGAELLILDDNFEEHFVRSLLSYQNVDMKRSWIGIKVYSENILQNWNTTSGSKVYYTHWSQLEMFQDQNNFIYDNPKFKITGCYVLQHDKEITSDNGMANLHCDVRLPSICKRTLSKNYQMLNGCATSINGTYYDLDVKKTIDNELCVRWDVVINSNPFIYHLNTELLSSIPFSKDGYISYSLDRCSEFRNDTKTHGYSCYIFKENQFRLKSCLLKLCNSSHSGKTNMGGHPFVILISLILTISALCFLIYVYRRNILSIYRVRVFMASVLGRYQPDWLRDAHNRTQTGTVGGTGFTNPIYTPLESRY